MIGTQNALRAAILPLSTPTSGYPRDPSAEKYITEQATNLSRPAFRRLLETQVARLLSGDALDIESLVDVLTLSDNIDATTALDRLDQSHLPEGRKHVARTSTWRRVYTHDDWAAISKTTGRSEEAQLSLLRNTAAYRTLRSVPADIAYLPVDAMAAPSHGEIAARFPDLPSSDIDALLRDHEDEISALQELIQNGLDEQISAIRELVLSDSREDVEM